MIFWPVAFEHLCAKERLLSDSQLWHQFLTWFLRKRCLMFDIIIIKIYSAELQDDQRNQEGTFSSVIVCMALVFTWTLPFPRCHDVRGSRPGAEACRLHGSWRWCEPLSWWACPPRWSGPPCTPSGEGWSRGHLYSERGAFTFSAGFTKAFSTART